MVFIDEVNGFSCPYCLTWYEDESEAEECIEECIDADPPTEETHDFYVCECCNKRYESEIDAIQCESKHDEKTPGWKEEAESRKRLVQAAVHPKQHRLPT